MGHGSSAHVPGCACVRCRGFQRDNTLSLVHGGQSEARIRSTARVQKRRFLRRIGLRASELDGVGLALLDNWARAQAKVEILDRHFEQVGLLDGDGEPRPATRIYFTALNSSRLSATRLAEHLKARGMGEASMVVVMAERARGVGT
jgi:hypothetical protein